MSDKKFVIFKKLEKVGGTYAHNSIIVQKYKIKTIPVIMPNEPYMYFNAINNTIEIEIKQTKEDMEEKGQCCDNRFEIIAKAKEALLNETNIARDEQEMSVIDNILFRCWQMGWLDKYEAVRLLANDDTKYSNSENIGNNLKPFNLEAAKAGKPICTRDGRKARIICFDMNIESYPILALINNGLFETAVNYNKEGKSVYCVENLKNDLMMLPEKKEGYVNLYHNCNDRYAAYLGNNVIYKDKEFALIILKLSKFNGRNRICG